MSFALSILDTDLAWIHKTFPGYPVFTFFVKALYTVTGSLSSAFAATGGLSVYIIILFSCRILRIPLISLEGVLLAFIIFVNPFIWLMSNRFMPDLLGTATALAIFHFFVTGDFKPGNVRFGWLAIGLLAGIKLSYLPLIIIPAAFALFNRNWISSLWLIFGILIWLLPLILMAGPDGFTELLSFETKAPFTDFSSTSNQDGFLQRVLNLFQYIWADGLGGAWSDRHWILWVFSAGLVLTLFAGIFIFVDFDYPKQKMLIASASLLLYIVSVLLTEENYFHPRNTLPLLPFFCMVMAYGVIFFLINFNTLIVKVSILFFLVGASVHGGIIAWSHKKPSALAQLSEEIAKEKSDSLYIVANNEIRNYLKTRKIKASFILPEETPEKLEEAKAKKIIIIGTDGNILGNEGRYRNFVHDPYTNRNWPNIDVYTNFSWQNDVNNNNKP